MQIITVMLAVEAKENHIRKMIFQSSSVKPMLHYPQKNKEFIILNGRKPFVHQRHNIHNEITSQRAQHSQWYPGSVRFKRKTHTSNKAISDAEEDGTLFILRLE